MEGLDAADGTHYLRAESAADWVTRVSQLLSDRGAAPAPAHNARALVEHRTIGRRSARSTSGVRQAEQMSPPMQQQAPRGGWLLATLGSLALLMV